LASQNEQLLEENKKLSHQLADLPDQFQIVVDELAEVKRERERKAALKNALLYLSPSFK
jgi:hypothetical protein